MNERQAFALANPLTDPRMLTDPRTQYRYVDEQQDGNLLVTILAVDR